MSKRQLSELMTKNEDTINYNQALTTALNIDKATEEDIITQDLMKKLNQRQLQTLYNYISRDHSKYDVNMNTLSNALYEPLKHVNLIIDKLSFIKKN